MPITLNSFTCSNGHTYEANAKLRARCPSCGVMAKRSFHKVEPPKVDPPKEEPPKEEPPKEEPPKEALPQEDPPKPEPRKPVLVRRGRERMPAPKKPTTPKQKALPPKRVISKDKVSAGLVGKKRITTRGVTPTVTGRPKRTAVARGSVRGHEERKPFWHSVADKYGL